ncbi:MAG: type II secretion system F family protein [Sphingomonadaceae bacterium]
MASYSYRAVEAAGRTVSGEIEADSQASALAAIRRKGLSPIEVSPTSLAKPSAPTQASAKARLVVTKTIGEIAVLLSAGLQLDRALALAIENVEHPGLRGDFEAILKEVKEGVPLSRAMAKRGGLFPPMASAMAEAGEADGKLGPALARLADALQQADDLRTLIGTAMIYPLILFAIATAVILMMLLFVVPQFENLFAGAGDKLPASSRFIMSASQALRANGLYWLLAVVLIGFGVRGWLRRPAARAGIDAFLLRLPQVGTLIRYIDTARFARALGVLIDGGVPLPTAMAMAQRSIGNRVISDAVGKVAGGIKEGGGLTAPLAAAGVFPKLALGFFRTGEEISQLGLMLGRLADVLDRDVKIRLTRLIGLLTPAITVILGVTVAAIIASIMTAILGFNDLVVS